MEKNTLEAVAAKTLPVSGQSEKASLCGPVCPHQPRLSLPCATSKVLYMYVLDLGSSAVTFLITIILISPKGKLRLREVKGLA